jgi:hypothetical protein
MYLLIVTNQLLLLFLHNHRMLNLLLPFVLILQGHEVYKGILDLHELVPLQMLYSPFQHSHPLIALEYPLLPLFEPELCIARVVPLHVIGDKLTRLLLHF